MDQAVATASRFAAPDLPTAPAPAPALPPAHTDPADPSPFYGGLDYHPDNPDLARRIHHDRYGLHDLETGELLEPTFSHTAIRVGAAVAAPSPEYTDAFVGMLDSMEFVPGGRVLSGAGAPGKNTLSNCFFRIVHDSKESIWDVKTDSAFTLSAGGGIGHYWGELRPKGALVRGVRGKSSGPMVFIREMNGDANAINQGGSRRGAMMAQMPDWHPDVEEFITWKRDHPHWSTTLRRQARLLAAGDSEKEAAFFAALSAQPQRFLSDSLEHYNVSVQVSSAFMAAVRDDRPWKLSWKGQHERTVSARAMFRLMAECAHECGDPGIFFRERVQAQANSAYYQEIWGSNPCGEIGLPDRGTCNLGSINLMAHLRWMGTNGSRKAIGIDWEKLERTARLATVFLDNVLIINRWPSPESQAESERSRRIGIGTMGLADVLAELGVTYGSPESLTLITDIYRAISLGAYKQSAYLARRRGSFGAYDRDALLARPFLQKIKAWDPALYHLIERTGLRNVQLTTQAPTGTTSMLAGVSSGIEPHFARAWMREDRVNPEGVLVQTKYGHLPHIRTAGELDAFEHVAVQAAAQEAIDQCTSKTVNGRNDDSVEKVQDVFRAAYEMGCKGVTYFRDGSLEEAVLRPLSYDQLMEKLAGMSCKNGICA